MKRKNRTKINTTKQARFFASGANKHRGAMHPVKDIKNQEKTTGQKRSTADIIQAVTDMLIEADSMTEKQRLVEIIPQDPTEKIFRQVGNRWRALNRNRVKLSSTAIKVTVLAVASGGTALPGTIAGEAAKIAVRKAILKRKLSSNKARIKFFGDMVVLPDDDSNARDNNNNNFMVIGNDEFLDIIKEIIDNQLGIHANQDQTSTTDTDELM